MNKRLVRIKQIEREVESLGPGAYFELKVQPGSNSSLNIRTKEYPAFSFVAPTKDKTLIAPPPGNQQPPSGIGNNPLIDLTGDDPPSLRRLLNRIREPIILAPIGSPAVSNSNSTTGATGVTARIIDPFQPLRNRSFDNFLDPGINRFPDIPPEPVPIESLLDIEIFVGKSKNPKYSKEEMRGRKAETYNGWKIEATELDISTPVGFAPKTLKIRFTNKTDQNITVEAETQFSVVECVTETKIPLVTLQKNMARIIASLDLKIRINGDSITFDTNDVLLKEKFKIFAEAETSYSLSKYGYSPKDINSSLISVDVSSKSLPGSVGAAANDLYPCIAFTLEFETSGVEFKQTDFPLPDANLTALGIYMEVYFVPERSYFDQKNSISVKSLSGNELRGTFVNRPLQTIQIFGKSNIKLDDGWLFDYLTRDWGLALLAIPLVNVAAVGVIIYETFARGFDYIFSRDISIEDKLEKWLINKIESKLQNFLDNNAVKLNAFFQIAAENMAGSQEALYDIYGSENEWRIQQGPVSPSSPLPSLPSIDLRQGSRNSLSPIDGTQPQEESNQLSKIDHIVVLMQENRSYDHILGRYSLGKYENDDRYQGLSGNEENHIKGVFPAAYPFPMHDENFVPGPSHDHEAVLEHINNGKMDGFAQQLRDRIKDTSKPYLDARSIMAFHTPGQLPAYDEIVKEYCVASQWFSSFPGGTWPNRFCAYTGGTPILENSDLGATEFGKVNLPTVFDALLEENVAFRIYEHDISFLRLFDNYAFNDDLIVPFSEFFNDVQNASSFPSVSFIEPNYTHVPGGLGDINVINDDHPSFETTSMLDGQKLIDSILDALRKSPAWDRTMFIITYDEHGGFYDHMPPPGSGQSPHNGVRKVHPDCPPMMGVRVPAFIISPLVRKGSVINRVFDHTSIMKTILTRFADSHVNKFGDRVRQAAHLGGALSLANARVVSPRNNQRVAFARNILSRATQLSASTKYAGKLLAQREEQDSFHYRMRTNISPVYSSEKQIRRLIP